MWFVRILFLDSNWQCCDEGAKHSPCLPNIHLSLSLSLSDTYTGTCLFLYLWLSAPLTTHAPPPRTYTVSFKRWICNDYRSFQECVMFTTTWLLTFHGASSLQSERQSWIIDQHSTNAKLKTTSHYSLCFVRSFYNLLTGGLPCQTKWR